MQTSRVGNWNRERGFTLLELIVVLIILSIMISIIVPRTLNFLFASQLKDTTRRVSLLIEDVRSWAIIKKTPLSIEFNLEKGKISYPCLSCRKGKRELLLKDVEVKLDIPTEDKQTSTKKIKIVFHPNGVVIPFTLYLKDRWNRMFYIKIHTFLLNNTILRIS